MFIGKAMASGCIPTLTLPSLVIVQYWLLQKLVRQFDDMSEDSLHWRYRRIPSSPEIGNCVECGADGSGTSSRDR
jgi:hypothetical protein